MRHDGPGAAPGDRAGTGTGPGTGGDELEEGDRSGKGTATKKRGGLMDLVRLITLALAAAAVAKELRQPKEQRTWHGTVAMVVPYDFRVPTFERAKERLWNPDAPSVVSPRVFGVGWTLNVGKLWAYAQEKRAAH